MNNYIKKYTNLIEYNLRTLFVSQIIFKSMLFSIILPIILFIVNKCILINKIEYINVESIKSMITNPISFILLILALFIILIFNMIDITSLIVLYDASYHKIKISFKELLLNTISKLKRLIHPKNIIIYIVLFLITMLLSFGLIFVLFINHKIPNILNNYYHFKDFELSILFVCICLLLYVTMKTIYMIHFMILDNKDADIALSNSYKLVNKNKIFILFKIIVSQIINVIILTIFIVLITTIITLFKDIIFKNISVNELITKIRFISLIPIYIYIILNKIFSIGIISNSFYNAKEEKELIINNYTYNLTKKKKILAYLLILVFMIISGYSVYNFKDKITTLNFKFEPYHKIEITAHRGANVLYPENTMEAFKKAYELGVEWIELDVVQSKDNQLVVSHDANLKRVSGVNAKIRAMNYNEIKKINVGYYKGGKYKGYRAPLLREVLEYFKDKNVKINIELKPKGNEVNFEQQIIDEVKSLNMEDQVIFASITYSCVKKVKELDPSLRTAYVMPVALGKFYNDENADIFSVEINSLNQKKVNEIHKRGKEVLAWTIDDENTMEYATSLKVDNIITDNLELAKEVNKKNDTRDYLQKYILKLTKNK